MATIKWVVAGKQPPPVKQRLLLIMTAAGSPPDAQLIDRSDVEVGYWTGNRFRLMQQDTLAPIVTHWAALASCLPKRVNLKYERRFDPDVRG
jgi:hypothetical protein